MNKHFFCQLIRGALLCVLLCFCCSCGNQNTVSPNAEAVTSLVSYNPGVTHVLTPVSDESDLLQTGPLTLDFSSSDQGYFIGTLNEKTRVNIQVTGPDDIDYKYFLEDENTPAVFPFTAGSGAYLILAFENIGGDQYTALSSYSLDVQLENDFLPFLYPNQYVSFSADSDAILLAAELSADAESDLDALTTIYNYVTQTICYDDEKAATVESGYLPDIDDTIRTGSGICFDYAALTVAMLRSLAIPARLNIGYSGSVRHAWVDVYIQSMGWVQNAIEFKGQEWKLMDPTFASAIGNELTNKYIGDGDNYLLEYVR